MVNVLLEMRYKEEQRVQYNQEEEEYHLLVRSNMSAADNSYHSPLVTIETKRESIMQVIHTQPPT